MPNMTRRVFTHSTEFVVWAVKGSGTTTFVAKKYSREWIGIEQNKEYVKIAKKRME